MRARDIHRRAWTRAPAVARHLLIPAALILMLSSANTVFAYDVESDSTSNTAYVLLRNLNPSAVFESITIGDSVPSFVSLATATIVPGSIPASASALGAIDFDITPAAPRRRDGRIIDHSFGICLRGSNSRRAYRPAYRGQHGARCTGSCWNRRPCARPRWPRFRRRWRNRRT